MRKPVIPYSTASVESSFLGTKVIFELEQETGTRSAGPDSKLGK